MSPREACATFLGEDFAEMPNIEYQPGSHGSTTIYTCGPTSYIFALPLGKAPSRIVKKAFEGCTIRVATGDTATYIVLRGKQIWIIEQE